MSKNKPNNNNKNSIYLIKDSKSLNKNNNIPNYKYEGGNGYECVKFTLKKNQSISTYLFDFQCVYQMFQNIFCLTERCRVLFEK